MARGKPHNSEIAEAFITDTRYLKNLMYVRSWDTFYLYEKGYYTQFDSRRMSIAVWEFIKEHYDTINLTTSLVADVVNQIKWISPRQVDEVDTPYIAFNDKLINTETFAFEEFSRDRIAIHKIHTDSDNLDTPIPLFIEFLKSTLVDDHGKTDFELVALIQEMFGFYLLNDLNAQKVFFLVGQGANGKSVMLNILEKVIGTDFCCAMSIESLTLNQFATSGLIGKKLNVCSEEESKYLRSDKFKSLISGDLIHAERKFEGSFSFRPRTKYIFATNLMPTFDGVNHGIRRRMMIVPFKRVFKTNEQNKKLTNQLLKELPGIIAWSIEGAKRLVKNNYQFRDSKAVTESIEEFENYTSSAILFCRENYQNDKEGFVDNEDIYKEYQDWCAKVGKKPLSMTLFNRDLRDNLGVEQLAAWNPTKSKTMRGHRLSLKPDHAPGVDLTMESVTAEFAKMPEQSTMI